MFKVMNEFKKVDVKPTQKNITSDNNQSNNTTISNTQTQTTTTNVNTVESGPTFFA